MPTAHYDFATYEQFLIGGFPYIVGRPNFQPIAIGTLKPGTKVVTIGAPGRNGKPTSANRMDTWTPWIEYMGMVRVNISGQFNGDQCAAFKLPPDGLVERSTGKEDGRDYFVLYIYTEGGELIRPNFNRLSSKVYKPIFKLYV